MATEGSVNETPVGDAENENSDSKTFENKCIEEIEKYILERHNTGSNISFADFLIDKESFVVENTSSQKDYKKIWGKLFGMALDKHNLEGEKKRANWKSIVARINNKDEPNGSTASSSKSSSGTPLNSKEKEFVNKMYTTLKNPKWALATDKIVEDTMHTFVKDCQYEHSSHSLIFDIIDPCWETYFTPNEMEEIRKHHKPQLKSLPVELKEYLNKFAGVHELEKLINIHMQNRFHPSQADLYWVEQTIGDILGLYYYQYDVDNKTEADVVRRLWGFIEKCFDESKFYVISGEKVSTSSSNRINENRSIPGVTPITRKKTGTKVDILIKYLYDDFGAGEAGLSGGSVSTKYITEANLKLPKSLKDITWNLLKMKTKDAQHLCIPGFIISGTELTVKLMDVPTGNICRLYTLGPMPFPLVPDELYKRIVPLITLVWQCKTLLKETLNAIKSDDNIVIPTIDDPIPTSTIPSCIPTPKKRKLSDVNTD